MLFLGAAGKKFAVEVDEKESCHQRSSFLEITAVAVDIRAVMVWQLQLPTGEAPVNRCPVGGRAMLGKVIAGIMGQAAS